MTRPNVIIVDQRGPVPDGDVLELKSECIAGFLGMSGQDCLRIPNLRVFVTNSLTKAHRIVVGLSLTPGMEHWSILLKEGLYIDAGLWWPPFSKSCHVEIVGLKDVRILFLKEKAQIVTEGASVVLKNLRIYDYRPPPP